MSCDHLLELPIHTLRKLPHFANFGVRKSFETHEKFQKQCGELYTEQVVEQIVYQLESSLTTIQNKN